MSEKTSSASPSMSAQALRKIKKPIIERKRRERINDSLNQLKALVLDALNKDESRYSKMEKADILEMTVRHLKAVQRQSSSVTPEQAPGHTSDLMGKYRAGYHECANEVSRYLSSIQGVGTDVQLRLLQHLSHRMHEPSMPVQQQTLGGAPTSAPAHLPILTTAFQAAPTATPISALPGGQLSVNTASPPVSTGSSQNLVPSSCSPILAATSPALPSGGTTTAPVIAVMSPTGLAQDTVLRNAIPLYVTPMNLATDSNNNTVTKVSPIMVNSAVKKCANKLPERAIGAKSPQLGDDVPEVFQKVNKPLSPPVSVIVPTTNNQQQQPPVKSHTPAMYPHARLPKTELCSAYSVTDYSTKSVWRPW